MTPETVRECGLLVDGVTIPGDGTFNMKFCTDPATEVRPTVDVVMREDGLWEVPDGTIRLCAGHAKDWPTEAVERCVRRFRKKTERKTAKGGL